MLFEIKLFSFVQMSAKFFEAMLDKTSLRKIWRADGEDKNFRQKLHFVIQGLKRKNEISFSKKVICIRITFLIREM